MQVHVNGHAPSPPSRAVQAFAALALGVAWFAGLAFGAALLLTP